MSEPRHWWIQKPTTHNCPLTYRGAVFQEYAPTIIDEPNCEWIKVVDAEAFEQMRKEMDTLIAANDNLSAVDMRAMGDIIIENKQLREQATKLAAALEGCRGSMLYAYEDRVDTYYLNVRADIEKALAKFRGMRK